MSDKFTSREVYVIFIYIMYHISERKADMKKNDDYIKRAAAVVPSERQLKWHELEFYAFIHFGMNTFTNSEWGNGNDDPVLFNPEKLNANQWAAAVRAAGMKAIILTCKHHDGFCLWPSEYTDYSVKKANGKTDRAMSCANAPKRAKIRSQVRRLSFTVGQARSPLRRGRGI